MFLLFADVRNSPFKFDACARDMKPCLLMKLENSFIWCPDLAKNTITLQRNWCSRFNRSCFIRSARDEEKYTASLIHVDFDLMIFILERSYDLMQCVEILPRLHSARTTSLLFMKNDSTPYSLFGRPRWGCNLQSRCIKSTHGSNTRTLMQFLLPTANVRFEFEWNPRPTLSAAANRKRLCFNGDEITGIWFF